jgi:hypothetical protein
MRSRNGRSILGFDSAVVIRDVEGEAIFEDGALERWMLELFTFEEVVSRFTMAPDGLISSVELFFCSSAIVKVLSLVARKTSSLP